MKQIYLNTQIDRNLKNKNYVNIIGEWKGHLVVYYWEMPHLFQIKAYGTCNGIFIQDLSEN